MECPKCKSDAKVKNGVVNHSQRYKCKDCSYNYTLDYTQIADKEQKKRFAIYLYMEGLNFHAIAQILGISHVSVLNWVRKYGSELEAIRNPKPIHLLDYQAAQNMFLNSSAFSFHVVEKEDATIVSLSRTEEE